MSGLVRLSATHGLSPTLLPQGRGIVGVPDGPHAGHFFAVLENVNLLTLPGGRLNLYTKRTSLSVCVWLDAIHVNMIRTGRNST